MTVHNDIPENEFPAHVRQMHLDGDQRLELEYKVCIHTESFSMY